MSVLDLLSSTNFISVNKTIAAEVGLEAAVILGELASEHNYWSSRNELEDGYFYSTVENLQEKTFLSGHNQRIAIEKLQEKGWIDIKKKGLPAKRYIKLNEDQILLFFVNNKSLKNLTTGDKIFKEQEIKNFNANNNISKNNIEKENTKEDIYISANEDFFDSLPDKPKKKFVPPTVEEVAEYCRERNNEVDPVAFVAYYASQNWKKANGRPVSDWKLCVITWEKKESRRHDPTKKSGNPFDDLLAEEGYT